MILFLPPFIDSVSQGRRGKGYKWSTFWIVMLDAVYQSLVIFFVAKAAYWGSDVDLWVFGTTITSSCLFTMLLHCAIEIKSWVCRRIGSMVINFIQLIFFLFFFYISTPNRQSCMSYR